MNKAVRAARVKAQHDASSRDNPRMPTTGFASPNPPWLTALLCNCLRRNPVRLRSRQLIAIEHGMFA
jgi:hypothetical protein